MDEILLRKSTNTLARASDKTKQRAHTDDEESRKRKKKWRNTYI